MNWKQNRKWFRVCGLLIFTFILAACSGKKEKDWIPLFNGKNLEGWHVKITGYDLDDNFGNTFGVEDGVMKVSYDAYEKFEGKLVIFFIRINFLTTVCGWNTALPVNRHLEDPVGLFATVGSCFTANHRKA